MDFYPDGIVQAKNAYPLVITPVMTMTYSIRSDQIYSSDRTFDHDLMISYQELEILYHYDYVLLQIIVYANVNSLKIRHR